MDTFTLKNKKFVIFVLISVVLSGVNSSTYTMQSQRTINKQATRKLKNAKKTEFVYLSPAANLDLRSKAMLHNVRVERYRQNQQKKQQKKTTIDCICFGK